MAIHIKKSKVGSLHKHLGVPKDDKIPASKLKIKSTDSEAIRKKKQFAINARNFKHLNGGTIGKYAEGGTSQNWTNLSPTDQSAGIGSQFSAPSVNNTQMPSYQTSQNSSVTPSAPSSSGTQLSGLGQSGSFANYGSTPTPDAPKSDYLTTSVTGAASTIPGSIAYGQKQAVLPGHNKDVDNLNKFNKASTSTGTKVGRGIGVAALNFIPLVGPMISQYGSMAVDKMVEKRRENLAAKANASLTRQGEAMNTTQNPFNQQTDNSLLKNLNNNPVTAQNGLRGMSKYANGGDSQLEQYNTGLHKDMPNSFANAQLKGKDGVTTPIQLQRKENIYRFKDGGDYVFTDNLMNPETGNLFSKDANKVIKTSQKPFLDEASTKVINHNMKGLSKINDKVRDEVEQKKLGGKIDFPMYAKNGGFIPKAIDGYNASDAYKLLQHHEQPIDNVNSMYTNLPQSDSPGLQGNFNKVTPTAFPTKREMLAMNSKYEDAPLKTSNQGSNLTPGDYAQLAGSAVAPIANIANFARKAEKVKAHLDNTQYSDPRIAKDFNPIYLAENAAAQDIDKGSLSDSVRRAARTSLAGNTQNNLANYSLAVDNQNKALQFQRDQAVAGTNRFNANQLTNRDTAQSQTNAVRRSYLNTGLAQAGQSLVDFGKMKNQGLTNNIELSTLNQLAADYGVSQETMKKLIADGRISTYFKSSKTGK